MRKYMTEGAIDEMVESVGIEAIQSFVEAGNTIVTTAQGAERLKEIEREKLQAKFLTEFMTQLQKIKQNTKKPHKKYPSNYTPSPRRHRKKKTKY